MHLLLFYVFEAAPFQVNAKESRTLQKTGRIAADFALIVVIADKIAPLLRTERQVWRGTRSHPASCRPHPALAAHILYPGAHILHPASCDFFACLAVNQWLLGGFNERIG